MLVKNYRDAEVFVFLAGSHRHSATVMWKAEQASGSQWGGAEKHKWRSGSRSAVTRWILHTGAAVVGFWLGRVQEGGRERDL